MIPTHFSPTFWTLKIFQLVCSAELPFLQGYKLHCDAQLAKIRSVFQVLPGAQEGRRRNQKNQGEKSDCEAGDPFWGQVAQQTWGFQWLSGV